MTKTILKFRNIPECFQNALLSKVTTIRISEKQRCIRVFFFDIPQHTHQTANVHAKLSSEGSVEEQTPVEEQCYLWWLHVHNACCRTNS